MRVRWIFVVLFAGCADPKLPDQLVEGKHVRYHYWKDMGPPCPEAIAEIDRFIEQLGTKVNRPAPADFRVDYYRVRDLDAVKALCIPRAAACAIENKVYSTEWTHDHEIVHAFLNRLGSPPLVFLESAAVMFGCGPARWSGAPLTPVDLEPLVDNDGWSKVINETNYAAAGSFARWLVDRHGLEKYVRFYEATGYRAKRDEVNAKFREVFGVELTDSLAEWHAGPVSRDGEFCLPVQDACDGAPDFSLNAPGGHVEVTAPVTCVPSVSVLEIGAVPVTRLRFTASEADRILKVRPCDPSGSSSRQLNHTLFGAGTNNLERWLDSWSMMKPGRYSLTVEPLKLGFPLDVPSPPGGTSSIALEAHGPVVGESCSVEAVPIPDDSWMVSFALQSSDAGVIRFEPASDRRIIGVYGTGFEGPLCSGCESPTACVVVRPGDAYPGFMRGPMSLQVDGGASIQFVLEAP